MMSPFPDNISESKDNDDEKEVQSRQEEQEQQESEVSPEKTMTQSVEPIGAKRRKPNKTNKVTQPQVVL